MTRPPRLGPYRVLGRLAVGPDGSVYRAYDVDRGREVLLVVSGAAAGAGDRVAVRLPGVTAGSMVHARPGTDQTWAALDPARPEDAAALVGLERMPEQHWFAAAYGWPHPYPRTLSQLAFRCLLTVVLAGVLVALAELLLSWP